MKPLVIAALLAVSLMSVPPVSADVIELRTGERVEGTFKGADDSAVRIEIDDRLVTFAPSQVRAIYFGSAPSVPAPSALQERDAAIGALEGLRSVARTGLTYPEYAPRVSEVQIVVNQYLRKEDGAPAIRGAIADSFHFYALAGAAWNAGLSRGTMRPSVRTRLWPDAHTPSRSSPSPSGRTPSSGGPRAPGRERQREW